MRQMCVKYTVTLRVDFEVTCTGMIETVALAFVSCTNSIQLLTILHLLTLHSTQDFHFPFTVVLYHLILKLVMAGALRCLYRCFTGKSRVHVDWAKSFRKLAPTGIAAGIDIGFSNWGLELVTISLYAHIQSRKISIFHNTLLHLGIQ